jgi:Uma2 family endonuclease
MVFQLDRPLQDSFQLERKRFTVKEFQRMVETGILEEGSPYELLNGEIIHMATIGSKHAAKVDRISTFLNRKINDAIIVRVQNPIELGAFSQPEPDIAILRWQDDFYESGHPTAQDIYLLIEVSDTTLDYDRTTKLPIYAESGIAEYWIVNLPDNQIEVYRNPSGNAYQSIQTVTKDQTLTIELLPEITIATADILG